MGFFQRWMKRSDRGTVRTWLVVFILPSAIALLWGLAYVGQSALLGLRGVSTIGSVTSVKAGTTEGGRPMSAVGSVVEFRYTVGSQTVNASAKCDPDSSNLLSLRVGDQIRLTADPTYPRIAAIEGSNGGPAGASLIFLAVVWVMIGVFGVYLFTPTHSGHHHGKGRLAH